MRKYHIWIFVPYFSGLVTLTMFGFRTNVQVSKGFVYQTFGKTDAIIYANKGSNPAIAMRRVLIMNKGNIIQSFVELAAAKFVIGFCLKVFVVSGTAYAQNGT